MGKAERTELDPHFEELGKKTDKVKSYTEKLVKDTEAILVPNPGIAIWNLYINECYAHFYLTEEY